MVKRMARRRKLNQRYFSNEFTSNMTEKKMFCQEGYVDPEQVRKGSSQQIHDDVIKWEHFLR